MANIVNLDRVSKAYGTTGPLLVDVSIGLEDDARVGVVGLNGAGKSTLLRIITKAEEPDSGRATLRRDLRVLSLPQALLLDGPETVRDVVLGTAWLPSSMGAEHEWAGDAGVRTVLDGLGMSYLGLDSPVATMSGGERRRVALAALLIRSSDLLVLDEPTNHLDVAGVAWLAQHLLKRRGALAVVTHDRWFLDAVCTMTWEVADETVRASEGGFAAWMLARAERQRVASETEARRQNLLRKEIAWLRRGPPARTSKPKFRIDAANALIADVPPTRDTVTLAKLSTARLGRQVYDLNDVTLMGGPKTLLKNLTWHVGPGDRIGLVGANGAGKSTLLRVLANVREPDGGSIVRGQTVKPAFLSQELTELPGGMRLLEAVEDVAKRVQLGDRELSAGQLAEVFGFTDRRIWTPVSDLSGGERRRLQMLRLLAGEPNVLLLDEPKNDLDTDTLASLEDLLDTWPGTMVIASHDRYLIERVTDHVYGMFGDGKLVHLPGGIDEYLARIAPASVPTSPSAVPSKGGAAYAAAKASAAEIRAAQKELTRLERLVARLDERSKKLHEEMAAAATDYAKIAELDAELRGVAAEREQAEEAWLVAAEAADA
jgi:ABC transport system ATP-binding/permease protein